MKRNLLAFFGIILVLGYFLGIRQLENFVLQETKKILPEFVSVEEISINPLSHIKFKNVSMDDASTTSKNFFQAKEIKIRFNVVKGVLDKDISAISAVVLSNANIHLRHYRDDSFNFVKLMDLIELPSDDGKELPDLDINIKLKDSVVEYYDERGFGSAPLEAATVNIAYDVASTIKFSNSGAKIKKFKANLNKNRNRMFMSGDLNPEGYWIKIKARDCEIAKEVNYFIPLPEIDIKNAEGDIEVVLQNNEVKKKTDLPVRFDINYKSAGTELKLAWLPKNLFVKSGTVLVSNSGVIFKNIGGTIEKEKFAVNGKIDDFYKLKIKIKGRSTRMQNAQEFLPFLKGLRLKGAGQSDVSIITNKENKIVISGKVEGYSGRILGYELDRAAVDFTFQDDRVDLAFPELNAYEGLGSGYGYVEMSKEFPPYVSLAVDIRDVQINKYLQADPFQGKTDLALRINSYTEGMHGVVDLLGSDATVFGQDLLQARLYWEAEKDRTVFTDSSFVVANTSDAIINFEGFLKKDNHFTVTVAASELETDDFYFFYTTGDYKARATFEGVVYGVYDEAFRKDPISRMSGELSGTVDMFEVLSPHLAMSGAMSVYIDKLLIVSADMQNTVSALAVATKVDKKKMKYLKIKAKNIDLDVAKNFVKPVKLDYEGTISCDVTLFPDKNRLFLKSYGVTGNVYLVSANIASQNIDLFEGIISLKNNLAKAKDALFVNNETAIEFAGQYRSTMDLALNISTGNASSKGWVMFPAGVRGDAYNVSGLFARKKGRIAFDLAGKLAGVVYNGVFLPDAKGHFLLDKEKITLDGVELEHFKDSYIVDGSVHLQKIKSGINPFDLNVKIIKGELENIFDLYNSIQINWRNKRDLIKKEAKANTSMFDKYNALLKRQVRSLYALRGDNVADVLDSLQVLDEQEDLGMLPGVYGVLEGELHLSYKKDLRIFSDLILEDGRYQFFSVKKMHFLSDLQDDHFDISVKAEKARVMNKSFQEMNLFAKYFPEAESVDIVNFFVKIDGHKTSDLLKGKISLKDAFKDKPNKEALDLYLFLNKNDIDVLTVFNQTLAKMSNDGTLLFHITGPFINPNINAEEASLRNFELVFVPSFMLRTPIRIASADIEIKDSRIVLPPDMLMQWQGLDTQGKLNEFVVNGEIGFQGFLEDYAGVVFDFGLDFKPITMWLDVKDIFKGEAKLFDISFVGDYVVPLRKELVQEKIAEVLTEQEKGPKLKAKVFVKSGVYQLKVGLGGSGSGLGIIKPPLLLDLDMTLGRNIQIIQKSSEEDLNRWLTNINILLDEMPEWLKVEGSLNTIDAEGRFNLNDGRIIFMNKVFDIMDKQKQREIFGAGSTEIEDNYVDVKMDPHPVFPARRKATPYFSLKTYSEIQKSVRVTENIGLSSNVVTKYEDHLFVIFVEGPINQMDSFSIEHYKKIATGYELAEERIYLNNMSAEQVDTVISYLVPAVFRPDFYRSILAQGIADNEEANEMLREYSASQINIWIDQQLRPFEQEIARNMGLYDVNIEHDLGGELVNAMQVFQRDNRVYEEDDNTVSVEYVKDLFVRKFFVKVKTGISQDPTKPLLDMTQYELVWFLNDFLSLNYGNYNLNDIDTMYGAFSLNANFIF